MLYSFAPTLFRLAAPGQPEALAAIATAVSIAMAIVGSLFFLSVVMTAIEAQAAAAAGRPGVLVEAASRALPALVCLVVAYNAQHLGQELTAIATAPSSPGDIALIYVRIATALARTVVLTGGFWVAVGVATGSLAAQLAGFTGRPGALSIWIERTVMVVVTAAFTVGAAQIATRLIELAAER